MQIIITINTDNAAFEPNPWAEVARILRELAGDAEQPDCSYLDNPRDYNGNTVGKVIVTE